MRNSFYPVAFLICASILGCSDDDLKKQEDLGGLRVLAIQAGTNGGAAEFSPGDASIAITPWISDFKGGPRTLSFEAQACVDVGVSVGADPSCEGIVGAVSFSGVASVPAQERVGATTSFNVNIPPTILVGRSAADRYNGVNYLVTYKLIASDGTSTTSFKRLVVSDKPVKNSNPTLTSISAGGSAVAAWPTSDVELQASYSASSIEGYTTQSSDGSIVSKTEELLTTWVKSAGKLRYSRTVNTDSTLFQPEGGRPTDHTPVVMAITRDGRGGVSVVVQSLP